MKILDGVSLVFLALSVSAAANDWPNWRGQNFDGVTSESLPDTLPNELPVLWKAEIGIGFSTVAVKGDRVVTMGNDGEGVDTIWCLAAESGKVLWKYQYECPLDPLYYEGGPAATPTIANGSVFTLSKKGHAFRLDLETGEVIWERDLIADHGFELPEWSFASSPFIDEDRVLLNVGRGGVALDRETGKTIWKSSTETPGYATVVPFPSRNAHLLFSAVSLIAFDSETGEQLWSYPYKSSRNVNAADPIVRDTKILISSSKGTDLLDWKAGEAEPELVWQNKDLKWYFNPGVLIGDHIYSIHGTTHRPTELVCTDFRTGKTAWSEEQFGSGALMAADDKLILFDNGHLTLFEATPEGYLPIHKQKILEGKCWTVPVLANGKIYCRNATGTLSCVGLIDEN